MNTENIANVLVGLLTELVEGAQKAGGYMLNGGDEGLLRSLDKLTFTEASTLTPTGSSIAAHVDHLRYGLSLMNRWGRGEDPFHDADWAASWRKTSVSERSWQTLRNELRAEAFMWLDALRKPRQVDDPELSGMIGSIAHLAYHFGAIRQINQLARGPAESGATTS